MPHVYRNRNTGDVVELAKPSHRLEGLANWERVEADATDAARHAPEPEPAPTDTTDEIASGRPSPEELRGTLAQATVAQLHELAAERGFDVTGIDRKGELVEAVAVAIEWERHEHDVADDLDKLEALGADQGEPS
jgi:hypothetical protein